MTMLKELATEFIGMFVGDARLTLAILALIGGAAILSEFAGTPKLVGGGFLLFGALALLIESVRRSARAAQR